MKKIKNVVIEKSYNEKVAQVKTDKGNVYQAVVEIITITGKVKEYLIGNYKSAEEVKAAFEGYRKAREISLI